METFVRDLRQAFRVLRQGGASFVVTAIVALALGIGANTAIFSLVNSVLLKEPPFPKANRIIIFETKSKEGEFGGASPAKFAHWSQQTDIIEDAASFGSGVMNWTGAAFPLQVRSERVSAAYFELFGAPVIRGRSFNRQEDTPGAPLTALISEDLWRQRFASNPGILGTTIMLGGDPYTVIGVVGRQFDFQDFGPAPQVFVPFQLDPNSHDQGHYFQAAARLKDGVTLERARAELQASAAAYKRKFPDALGPDESFAAASLRESLVRYAQKSIWVMVGAVAFVLLIACANVANLLLARAETRKRELAIRAALGAGRARIVRQLLTESLLLASAGAILGIAIGWLGMRALLTVNTAGLPRIGEAGELVTLDWRVLIFTISIALLTSLLFGLLPALHATHADLSATIKESASRTGSGFRRNKARTSLVIAEVALAVVLLVGAGLLIRTSLAIYGVSPGFSAHNILTMRMSLSGKKFETSASIERLVKDGVERIQAIPGVELASATCCIPLEGGYGLPFRIMGRPLDKGQPFHGGGGWKTVSPGYFEVFKIRMLRGRTFNERDTSASTPVVIISEAMAKKFWPKSDPMQDRILIGKGIMPQLDAEQPRQIVGIVSDLRDGGLNQDPGPEMFIVNAQVPDAIQALNVKLTPLAWVVRTHGDPLLLRGQIEEVLRQVCGLPVSDVRPMTEVVSRSTSRESFHTLLMSVFGGVSLLLAAIGIYGLMAYSVEQRTQEIGIRMALGAEAANVRGMVMKQGMVFASIGIVVGIAAAFALAQQIASFLFEVKPWDPLVFVSIPVTLAVVALVAIWWPALRATRVDPASALRQS